MADLGAEADEEPPRTIIDACRQRRAGEPLSTMVPFRGKVVRYHDAWGPGYRGAHVAVDLGDGVHHIRARLRLRPRRTAADPDGAPLAGAATMPPPKVYTWLVVAEIEENEVVVSAIEGGGGGGGGGGGTGVEEQLHPPALTIVAYEEGVFEPGPVVLSLPFDVSGETIPSAVAGALDDALFRCCRFGSEWELEEVLSWLDDGRIAEIDRAVHDGANPLQLAAYFNHPSCMKVLLRYVRGRRTATTAPPRSQSRALHTPPPAPSRAPRTTLPTRTHARARTLRQTSAHTRNLTLTSTQRGSRRERRDAGGADCALPCMPDGLSRGRPRACHPRRQLHQALYERLHTAADRRREGPGGRGALLGR